jgi:hypothetical protein
MQGLSVSRVVNVEVQFTPQAAAQQRFDTLLIIGDTPVVDSGEGIREYNTIEDVAGDFGTTAPEYLGATLFFGQIPQPGILYIGTWARTATKGRLTGGPIPPVDQLLSDWNTITNGGFDVVFDGGTSHSITGLDFATALNLNNVASLIQTALEAAAPSTTFVWNGQQFVCSSGTTGPTSSVGYFTAATTGTDISAQLLMTQATAERTAPGLAPETPVACVARLDGRGWYACTFCASVPPADADHLAVSAYVEAAADPHIYGISTNEATILDSASTSDIASQEMLAEYMRTVIQYSINSPNDAICSFFGRALTVNFQGSNTTITMKFKIEPGIIPELLSASEASTIAAKRANVYVQYNNGTSITQEGVMSGPAYFDEIHGLDWLSNSVQTAMWNLLYGAPKVPQTNPGVHMLVNTADGSMSQGVVNGLIAPGVWNAPGFGTLNQGDTLQNGWYTFANSVDTQDQADREARIAPLIQIAVKLAGAIHFANVLINVNR